MGKETGHIFSSASIFRRIKGKEFSKTLFQTLYELKGEIKEMKQERHEGPSKIYLHEKIPSSSSYICKHSATQSGPQRYSMPRFTAREMKEEDAPKETLSDYI